MIRHYCDFCGDLITPKNECAGATMCSKERLGIEVEKNGVVLRLEIMTGFDGTWNNGCVCRYCVLDALNLLDTRKKQKPKKKPIKV